MYEWYIIFKAEQQQQNAPSELQSRPKILRTPAGTLKNDLSNAGLSPSVSQELSSISKIQGQNVSNPLNDSLRQSVNEFSASNAIVNSNQKTEKEQKREKVRFYSKLRFLIRVNRK